MSSSSEGYHAHSRAASLAADPRSVLGSDAARSCQQPGLAPALARGDYVEIGERDGELAGAPMSQRCCVTMARSAGFGHVLCAAADAPGRTPASRAAGLPSPPGRACQTSLQRAGLIDINGHDSPHSPTRRTTLIHRSHRRAGLLGLLDTTNRSGRGRFARCCLGLRAPRRTRPTARQAQESTTKLTQLEPKWD
jgi:hypothetical protein